MARNAGSGGGTKIILDVDASDAAAAADDNDDETSILPASVNDSRCF